MADRLGPIPQKYYDDNRKEFEAETSAIDLKDLSANRCSHFFYRKSWGRIECQRCHIGYIDNHRMLLKEGKIVGIQ